MGAPRRSSGIRSTCSTTEAIVAGTSISSFDQAVHELVENSIAAHAANIEIHLVASSLSVTVVDDGKGMSCQDLERVGIPHCTTMAGDKIQESSSAGKLGLSVFSLAVTSILKIASRAQGEFQTWEKNFMGRTKPIVHLASRQQLGSGTSMELRDFMSFQPVRRKQLLEERCLNCGRKHCRASLKI